jgi:hypothetical protein
MSFNGFANGGSLTDILTQVDNWMRNNPGEVIGIHFTRNQPVGNRSAVFTGLVPLLEMMWGEGRASGNESASATEMSTYYSSNSDTWPTLGTAVGENRRIFVFVDDELSAIGPSRPWINPTPFSTLSPEGLSFGTSCQATGPNFNPGIFEHASRCNASIADNEDLVIAIGYTLVPCISEGQDSCNEVLQNATEVCYGLRQAGNRTVNIVLVDFPNIETSSIFEIVSELNARNVQRYVTNPVTVDYGVDITTSSDMTNIMSSATDSASCLSVSMFSGIVLSFGHFIYSLLAL